MIGRIPEEVEAGIDEEGGASTSTGSALIIGAASEIKSNRPKPNAIEISDDEEHEQQIEHKHKKSLGNFQHTCLDEKAEARSKLLNKGAKLGALNVMMKSKYVNIHFLKHKHGNEGC